jgi:hypothetical protein
VSKQVASKCAGQSGYEPEKPAKSRNNFCLSRYFLRFRPKLRAPIGPFLAVLLPLCP